MTRNTDNTGKAVGGEQTEHCQTMKPRYDGVKSWSENGDEVNHVVESHVSGDTTKVVFDVETNAKPPQKPVFAVVYDDAAETVYVAHSKIDSGSDLFSDEIIEVVRDEFSEHGIDEVTIEYSSHIGVSWFSDVLSMIDDHNMSVGVDGVHKELVAHNALFDIGMLGKNDDELIGDVFDADRIDGVVSCNDWSIGHAKAGAYGRIFNFKRNLDSRPINVFDTQTVAESTRRPKGLEDLCEHYGVRYHEDENQEHGKVTEQYIRYNVNDVLATLEVSKCLETTLSDEFGCDTFALPGSRVYSSASIAKQKLRELGYNRVHYSERAAEICSAGYFGGQTEALTPGKMVDDVTYTDFLSQYPTASALTDVWEFMQCERVEMREVSVDELPKPSLDEFKKPETWGRVSNYYVAVSGDEALLPVRAQLSNVDTTRVYKANVTHESSVVLHYMDVIGALLHGEGSVEIHSAFEMVPVGFQSNLLLNGDARETTIGGTTVKSTENLMQRGIEERKRVQFEENDGEKDGRTLALKVVSNSLYGVGAERVVEKEVIDGDVRKHDEAGTFYSPHMAATCTATGRLMLTIGEVVAGEGGGELHYCDTDSLVVDESVTDDVIGFFNDLNPYNGYAGELDFLEVEDADGVPLRGVSILSIGVKKYCVVKDGRIVMNKEHGLGHYKQFRGDTVKRFWSSLVESLTTCDVRDTGLLSDELPQPVFWQTSASTAMIRRQMQDLHGFPVRYGDFVERTITLSEGCEKQYVGLGDEWLVINHTTGGVERVSGSIDMLGVKRVSDVLNGWVRKGIASECGRRSVVITGTRKVTKEATDVADAWNKRLREHLELVDFVLRDS